MTGLRGWGSRARLRTGVASSRVRFEQRAAAVRSRPKRIIAWGVALLVLMGLVGWVFWMSPVFTVDEVRVEEALPMVRHRCCRPRGSHSVPRSHA